MSAWRVVPLLVACSVAPACIARSATAVGAPEPAVRARAGESDETVLGARRLEQIASR